MANSVGVDLKMEYAVEHLTGKSLKSAFDYLESQLNRSLPNNFEKEYRKNTFKEFKVNLKPIEGVHDLLNKILIPYCVDSSGPVEKIKLNLTTTNLIDKFENRIFGCFEINSWKPESQIYMHAAKVMGFKFEECVVIEDRVSGIIAAVNGGFDVCALANDKNKEQLNALGANVFFRMSELYDIIDKV